MKPGMTTYRRLALNLECQLSAKLGKKLIAIHPDDESYNDHLD